MLPQVPLDSKILYRNAFATSIQLRNSLQARLHDCLWRKSSLVRLLANCERKQQLLKIKSHRFEHNYGHGKQHLSSLLAIAHPVLAYLLHTVLEWMDDQCMVCYAKSSPRDSACSTPCER
jgi:hypothetical protein